MTPLAILFLVMWQTPPELAAKLTAYEKAVLARQAQIQCIRTSLKGSNTIPMGVFSGDPSLPNHLKGRVVPEKDQVAPVSIEFLLDFVGKQVYKRVELEIFSLGTATLVPSWRRFFYDGKEFWTQTPTHLIRYGNERTEEVFETKEYPILWACGWTDFGPMALHLKSRFRGSPLDGIVDVKPGDQDGLRIVKQPSPGLRVVLEVAAAQDYLPATCELWYHGKLSMKYKCRWKQDSTTWIPDRWETTSIDGGKVQSQAIREVVDWRSNPALTAADFRPSQPEKSEIHDYSDGKNVITKTNSLPWWMIAVIVTAGLMTILFFGRWWLKPQIERRIKHA